MGGEGGKSPELAIHTELLTLALGANSHQLRSNRFVALLESLLAPLTQCRATHE
jgi:hypothetical protein